MQLLVAGKAHPADRAGRRYRVATFRRQARHRRRVVFLEDYDMRIAQAPGARRRCLAEHAEAALEASGTSGMKVLANGGLNLSQLDGWWAEACADLGWAVGDGRIRPGAR